MYLDRPILSNQLVLHLIIPQSSVCEVFQQVGIHNLCKEKLTQQHFLLFAYSEILCCINADLKLSREHPAGVDVACVGFNGLIVPQDLGCGGGGHRGQEQTVLHTVSEDKRGGGGGELNPDSAISLL